MRTTAVLLAAVFAAILAGPAATAEAATAVWCPPNRTDETCVSWPNGQEICVYVADQSKICWNPS